MGGCGASPSVKYSLFDGQNVILCTFGYFIHISKQNFTLKGLVTEQNHRPNHVRVFSRIRNGSCAGQKVDRRIAENFNLKGLHRLDINDYLSTFFFVWCN